MTISTGDLSAITSLPKALASGDDRLVAASLYAMKVGGTSPGAILRFYNGKVTVAAIAEALGRLDSSELHDSLELQKWQQLHPYADYFPAEIEAVLAWALSA